MLVMSSPGENNVADFEHSNAGEIIEYINSSSSNNSDSLNLSTDSINSFEHGDLHSTVDNDSDEDDGQVSENGKNWTVLPSLAVENIYSFLSRTDQSRMSLVCSRWSKDFNSPSLWKTMKFYLPEHDYSSEVYPEVRFARKYASMFRNVEIICKRVRIHLIDEIRIQLKLFLQAMTSSSQLTSIKFMNLGNYLHRLDDAMHEEVFRTIISFFNSQQNLKTVVFQDSRFDKEDGMELLNAIFHSQKNTIKNLTLRGFVNDAPITVLRRPYVSNLLEVSSKLPRVQSLEVDYTQIFEDVLNCMHENLISGYYQVDKKEAITSTLYIYCKGERQSQFRGILSRTWRYLTNVFPAMKVKMDITIHSHLDREMEKFLVREIPLQALDFRFEKLSTSSRIDISTLFRRLQICTYQDHLEVLNVFWMPSVTDIADSVVPFVQSCKKLQTFHLHANCPPSEIENALKDFLENHPASLKSITIWFNCLQDDEDEGNVAALSEEYYPLFIAQGIECFLIMEPSRRLRRRVPHVVAS